MEDDWRLIKGQEKYLYGETLIMQAYRPKNPSNDHDHCEFCMAKFGNGNNDLHYGFSTKDREHWICTQCFEDFKYLFKWKLSEPQNK